MNIHVFAPSFRAAAPHMLSHVPWTGIKHLTRGCHHPQNWLGHHRWAVEGHAPWEQNQRSNWAQNPQSWAASRLFNHEDGWYSGSGQNRVVGGWNRSNSHLQKKRSGSCNSSWSPSSGALSLEHSARFDRNFRQSFPRLHEVSFSHHQQVGDAHWELCLFLLLFFGEDHFGRLYEAHWGICLWKPRLSFEHIFGWLCDAHWGQCLSKLHLTCEHHFWWLCHAHWGQCLSQLCLFGEYHFWWLCDAHWEACLWRLHHAAPLRWANLCRRFLTFFDCAFNGCVAFASIILGESPTGSFQEWTSLGRASRCVSRFHWPSEVGSRDFRGWGSQRCSFEGPGPGKVHIIFIYKHQFSQVAHSLYVPF